MAAPFTTEGGVKIADFTAGTFGGQDLEILRDGGAVAEFFFRPVAVSFKRDDAGSETEGLREIVRHNDDGEVGLVPQFAHQDVDVGADTGVEGAEGFVEEQDLGLAEDGLGEGKPLLLAAREGAGNFFSCPARPRL